MERTSFNDGWQVREKPDMAAELMGGASPWAPVRLPHDAMITTVRHPGGTPAAGYFPGGIWQYQKSFAVREEQRGRRIMVEFEGVYRSAAVYVNGVLAGHRPYGYSDFTVRLDPLVRYGEDNTITVEATAHDDSRWYSGAGIYRNAKLVVGHPVHIALDGVRIATPDIDDLAAVVMVETTVENDTGLPVSSVLVTELVDEGDDRRRPGRVAAHRAPRPESDAAPARAGDGSEVLGRGLTEPLHLPHRAPAGRRGDRPGRGTVRDPHHPARRGERTPHQRGDAEAAGRVRAPRQRRHRRGHDRARRRTAGSSCSRKPASTRCAARTIR